MAKYTEDDRKAMAAKGHAMPDGSYPIADAEDLDNAIHAVGRGGADHDAIRKHIIKRAKALGLSSKIPGNWNADGSLGEAKAAQRDPKWEQRRKRWAAQLIRQAARRNMQLEMRAKPDGTGGTTFEFEGYGAVFDAPFQMWDPWGDPYTEVVRPGAFTRTPGHPGPGRAVPDRPQRWQSIPLAQTSNGTMKLSRGLQGPACARARWTAAAATSGTWPTRSNAATWTRCSIGFVTMGQEWSPDWGQRDMLDLELHEGDVSAVAIAANRGDGGLDGDSPAGRVAERTSAG